MDTMNSSVVGFDDDSKDDALFNDIALLATQVAIPGFGTFLTQSVENVEVTGRNRRANKKRDFDSALQRFNWLYFDDPA